MRHLDRLLQRDPKLRGVDFQRLVQRARQDPQAHWPELVEASMPVVYTLALRLADDLRNGEAMAEEATREVFAELHDTDFAVVREYIGYGKWPSLLLRLTQNARVLADRRSERENPVDAAALLRKDNDGLVPELEPRVSDLIHKEGDRFSTAMKRVIHILHRQDRLLLGMRYEQGLTLRELDHLFRLGSPERVQSLLDRLVDSMQPIRAVADAWDLDHGQKHAVVQHFVKQLYASGSMETGDDRKVAAALQQQ